MDEERIFLQAIEFGSFGEREAFVERECGGDVALRECVRQLIRSHDDAGSFLESPPSGVLLDRTERLMGETDDLTARPPGERTECGDASAVDDLSFLGPTSRPDSLGTIGPYEVVAVVGRGGMGIVLKALDTKLNRTVAVKVLAPELAANVVAKKRFLREAQAAAAVTHPHVVTIHAVDEDRVPYLVMEFVPGLSLREKIERVGTLGVTEILRIGSQIAAGLAAAHKQGLIHRDIKPANILLENGVERVKITDFGLARAVDDLSVTRTGEVAGTPQYMSPEQAQGERVDHRGDLFSLGSVLYTMCTGRPPFRGDSAIAVIRRVVDDTPRPIREVNADIPAWLCDIIDRLLAKNPDDRHQTAAEVAALLEQRLARMQHPATAGASSSAVLFVGEAPATVVEDSRRIEAHPRASGVVAGMGSKGRDGRWTMSRVLTAAGGLAALVLLAGIIIKVTTKDGTVSIEVPDGAHVEIVSDGSPAKPPTGAVLTPTPSSMWALRSTGAADVGKVFYFELTGSNGGSVWGSDVYTDDSSLAAAAVHAGVLKAGERDIVKVTVLPGRSEYAGVARNGVTSLSWLSYPGSFRIESLGAPAVATGAILENDPNLWAMRDQVGKTLQVRTTGRTTGVCYGTDVYSDDSDVATAAVHAGVLRDHETGVVRVTLLSRQDQFVGSQRNGVPSRSFGSWGGSYRIEKGTSDVERTSTDKTSGPPLAEIKIDDSIPHLATSYWDGRPGSVHHVAVTGKSSGGTIFGTDVYTGDSWVDTAAVHAGVLRGGEKGVVLVTVLPGQSSYAGSSRNGVASLSWGSWPTSYRVEKATGTVTDPVSTFRGQSGKTLVVQLVGRAAGPCYGTDVYTDDSDPGVAAVHAGILRDGQRGVVKITILDGQPSYSASIRNGVSSYSYGLWPGSYRIEAAPQGNDAKAEKGPANGPAEAEGR